MTFTKHNIFAMQIVVSKDFGYTSCVYWRDNRPRIVCTRCNAPTITYLLYRKNIRIMFQDLTNLYKSCALNIFYIMYVFKNINKNVLKRLKMVIKIITKIRRCCIILCFVLKRLFHFLHSASPMARAHSLKGYPDTA